MTMVEFGEAMRGRAPADRAGTPFDAPLRWPNEREPKVVPASASLRGDQYVHGAGTPDIRFAIGDRQDFLAPVEMSVKGALAGPVAVSWKAIPNAQGYFLQAMGHRESTGEMIIWTSSELQDTGWGLMNYLPNDFLRKMIADKVVLPPEVTACAIPKGIFDNVQGAMLQSIAYGEELNLVHPPRPTDPKVPWEQVWTAKVRVKSTGMTPLGMDDGTESSARGPAGSGNRRPAEAATATQPPNPLNDAADAVNKVRGLFGF